MARRLRSVRLTVGGAEVPVDSVQYSDSTEERTQSGARSPIEGCVELALEAAHTAAKVLGSRLTMALDCLETASREMAGAGLLDLPDDERQRLWNALAPTDILLGKDQALFTAHVRELIERHRRGEPLSPATDAEALCLLSETSLKAPLNREGFVASQLLFERVYGAEKRLDVMGELERESYPGAVDELIAEAKRRLGAMR